MERKATCISLTDYPSCKKKKKKAINTGYFTPICNTSMFGITTGKKY